MIHIESNYQDDIERESGAIPWASYLVFHWAGGEPLAPIPALQAAIKITDNPANRILGIHMDPSIDVGACGFGIDLCTTLDDMPTVYEEWTPDYVLKQQGAMQKAITKSLKVLKGAGVPLYDIVLDKANLVSHVELEVHKEDYPARRVDEGCYDKIELADPIFCQARELQ